MHAVIVERNKGVGRKIARLFLSAGVTVTLLDDPEALGGAIGQADLLCADAFDGDLVTDHLRARPALRGVLWTAEPLRRSLGYLAAAPAIQHVLGRKDFDSAPRAWELLAVARRLAEPGARVPLAAYLDWGFMTAELAVRTTADRDRAVTAITEFAGRLQLPRRVGEMFGELGHELIMNALYDAPVDAHGRPRFAGDRKAEVALAPGEQPTVQVATDGSVLVLRVCDPFGRLERHHVVDGLARALAGGELDRTNGGAGLGLAVCHHASSAMMFDVVRGRHTEVTALLEIDVNLRELRTQARSLHVVTA